ncbi:Chaperone protein dnaJ 3, partial [Diplonema papillatum]
VTLNEALTGFALPIEHLDGRQIVIKTRPHQVLDPQKLWVIDREGMPVKGTGGVEKGSLVITLKVKFPEKLKPAQVQGLQEALGKPDKIEKMPEHEEVYLTAYTPSKRKQRRGQRGMGGGMPGGIHMMEGDGAQQATCAHQ